MEFLSNKLKGFSLRSPSLLGICFLGAAILSFFPYSYHVNSLKKLSGVYEGSNICFSRVTQSFTAKMLGDNGSSFLTKDFLSTTDDCFADIESSVLSKKLTRQIDELSSEVNWFHERLNVSVIDLTGNATSPALVQNRYSKVESLNDFFLEALESEKTNISSYLFILGALSFVTMLFSAFFMMKTVLIKIKEMNFKDMVEKKAHILMSEKEVVEPTTAKVLISDTLRRLELEECSELLKKIEFNHRQEEISNELPQSPKKTIDSIGGIRVATVIEQVFNRLKDQVYAHGVRVQIDIDDELKVKAPIEEFLIISNELIGLTLKKVTKEAHQPAMKVKARALGSTVVLDIEGNGDRFSNKLLQYMKKQVVSNEVGTSLVITKELLGELDGKLKLENLRSGTRFQVILRRASKEEKAQKEVKIVKGTKKEVAKMISASTNSRTH